MTKPQHYNYTIDAIRVIGIVLVLIIHVSGQFVNQASFFKTPQWWIPNFIDSASRVAVPLFVMISGQLILHSSRTAWSMDYFKRRVKRVGIPLVVWSVIYIAFQYFFRGKIYTIPQALSAFFAPSIYYHLYFLYIILGLYSIAPLLGPWLKKLSNGYFIVFLSAFFLYSAGLFLVLFFIPGTHSPLNSITFFIPYVPYFAAGFYLREMTVNRTLWYIFASFYCLLSALTAFLNTVYMQIIGWGSTHQNYSRYFYEHFSPNVIIMSLIAFVLLHNLPRIFPTFSRELWRKGIKHLAPYVFGIYLLHPMLLDMLDRLIPVLNTASMNRIFIVPLFLIKVPTLFGLTYAIILLCKRSKFLGWIFV